MNGWPASLLHDWSSIVVDDGAVLTQTRRGIGGLPELGLEAEVGGGVRLGRCFTGHGVAGREVTEAVTGGKLTMTAVRSFLMGV